MLQRTRRWSQFQVERFLLGGAHYRLLLIVATIGALSVGAGMLVHWFDVGDALTPGEAIWWAFLRLTDPGYLGDDHGNLRRMVSTALTVAGYVLFLGALVATMTQGLNDQIRRLERGFTPVALKNHIVVVGWTASTPELLAQLTSPGQRVERFLRKYRTRGLRIAVLAEEVGHELEQELRDRLGKRYSRTTTVLRSGSPLQQAHLERVDCLRAAAIVFSLPEQARSPREASDDAHLAKAIVTLSLALQRAEHVPTVVAAVSDPLKLRVIRRAYPVGHAELFSSSVIVARMLARFARHRGMSHVIEEMLSQHWGSELYLHDRGELAGLTFRELLWRFSDGIVLGSAPADSTRPVRLQFQLQEALQPGDSLVVLAREGELGEWDRAAPDLDPESGSESRDRPRLTAVRHRSLFIIGWNQRMPWLLRELDRSRTDRWRVLVMASVGEAERATDLARSGVSLEQADVKYLTGDATAPQELKAAPFAEYETILIVGSDRLESAEDADARSLLIYQLMRYQLLKEDVNRRIMVELRDPSNADLFDLTETEVIPTSVLITHVLAQVALRPELRRVLDALFSVHGPEIEFIEPATLGAEGRSLPFGELMLRGARLQLIVLGVQLEQCRKDNAGIVLNPARDTEYVLQTRDRVVVLAQLAEG